MCVELWLRVGYWLLALWVFHGKREDKGKRNLKQEYGKLEARIAATLVSVSKRLQYQYCSESQVYI